MVSRQRQKKGPSMNAKPNSWECPVCGKGPEQGLALTPSGKQISRHKDGTEVCEGKAPQSPDPEPVKVVPANAKPNEGECVECGAVGRKLKTPGKITKHTNPETLTDCEQRPSVDTDCPVCQRQIGLQRMRFKQHKDLKIGRKCPASGHTVTEAQALTKVKVPTGGKKAKPEPKEKRPSLKDLSPLDKSKFKATKLGDELKQYADPWRYTVETGPDPDQATLVLKRGTGKDIEEMRISWWSGACLGGEGRITHEFRGRKIAVRNANAVRQRGNLTHEAVKEEYARVSTRKAPGPRKQKTVEELQEVMPFDPKEADDSTVIAHLKTGRTIKWQNVTSGKTETDVLSKLPAQPIKRTKTGIRQLTFNGKTGTRTVRIENLVSVG
jgi:hypothetical protein